MAHSSPMPRHISAPSLQTFSIHHTHTIAGINFVSQNQHHWTSSYQDDFLPTPHTLELVDCLQVNDVPHLIRWLARLPSLVRLVLFGDLTGMTAEYCSSAEETNILRALASPQRAGTLAGDWLCPSLIQLHLATVLIIMDLINLAHAKGDNASPSYFSPASPPSRLRVITAPLCPSESHEKKQAGYCLMWMIWMRVHDSLKIVLSRILPVR